LSILPFDPGLWFDGHVPCPAERAHYFDYTSSDEDVARIEDGDDGIFGGAPDSEDELTFTPSTVPAFVPGSWAGLDVPLEDFARPAVRGHLAQLILSGASIIFVDNVYFHR
jgi:hypothetical protein